MKTAREKDNYMYSEMEELVQKLKPKIQLTGFKSTEKETLVELLFKMDCIFIDCEKYSDCSHLIAKKVCKSEKWLAACAAGKWVLAKDYIIDSVKSGRWLDEATYEWGYKVENDSQLSPINSAPKRWREELTLHGFPGAFHTWKVMILIKDGDKGRDAFERVLLAGKATICNYKNMEEGLTHVFTNNMFVMKREKRLFHAPYYPVRYLGDFLLEMAALSKDTFSDLDQSLSETRIHLQKKKMVTFGRELSPEIFDKTLPANTPLRKGKTPDRSDSISSVKFPVDALSTVQEPIAQPNFDDGEAVVGNTLRLDSPSLKCSTSAIASENNGRKKAQPGIWKQTFAMETKVVFTKCHFPEQFDEGQLSSGPLQDGGSVANIPPSLNSFRKSALKKTKKNGKENQKVSLTDEEMPPSSNSVDTTVTKSQSCGIFQRVSTTELADKKLKSARSGSRWSSETQEKYSGKKQTA